ncbi:MAG: 4Fe-4S binding protein [Treponema sp.]|uniref:4Fe-4S binding protein n=1 Tax=Treponema sp. TaxID=166 RepID=UPI001D3FD3F4|nr:4Fe-4S binding protein [Treponema sp.]MBS7241816.1 4Fe-4S binding protein [Treponema sp.]
MIFTIFMMLLFLVLMSIVFAFIFELLVPSLRAQNISFNKPIFSENEIRVRPSLMETFKEAKDTKAVVMCSSRKKCGDFRFEYDGPKSCTLYLSICDTEHDCKYGCIGFGDCVKFCTRKAISIENRTAVINNLCNGCGKCLEFCPKGIIKLVPVTTERTVFCSAPFSEKTKCSDNLKETDINYGTKDFKLSKKLYKLISKGSD